MVKKIYFNNLRKNQFYTDSIKVTDVSIKKFSSASGDRNPIHLNEKFAKNTIFKSRIAHGMLIASFISSISFPMLYKSIIVSSVWSISILS